MRNFKDGDRVFAVQASPGFAVWNRNHVGTIRKINGLLVFERLGLTGRRLYGLVICGPRGLCRYAVKDEQGNVIASEGGSEWRVFHLPPDRGRRYQTRRRRRFDWHGCHGGPAEVTIAGRPSHLRALVWFEAGEKAGSAVVHEGDRAVASFMILRDGRPLYRYAGVPVYRVLPPAPRRRFWHL